MKLYKYTLLKQDGTKQDLGISKKKGFEEMYKILNCSILETIPSAYYKDLGFGKCTCYGDEEGRFNNYNFRNPHFAVLKGNPILGEPEGWDVVGDIIKEETSKL